MFREELYGIPSQGKMEQHQKKMFKTFSVAFFCRIVAKWSSAFSLKYKHYNMKQLRSIIFIFW